MVGGDRRIPSYGSDYRYAREDKDVDVQQLLAVCWLFESFGGFSGRRASPVPSKVKSIFVFLAAAPVV